MARDIDQIILGVQGAFPDVRVVQLQVTHAADDDGLWWFRLDGKDFVQIESSYGNCPFIIESSSTPTSQHALNGETIEQVVKRSLLVFKLA